MATKTQPLQGVKILDLSHVIAGPLASFYLAQLGATVIKVEPPEKGEVMRKGGGTPDEFVAYNAGKHSQAIDIRTPQGVARILELSKQVDVVLENFRPGVMRKRGLGYEDVKAVNPDIIYCSISGYGQKGTWSERGGYDHVIQGLTGMMMRSGNPADDAPIKVGFPVVDVATGMLGAMSILAALRGRDHGAGGQHVDVSMVQASLALMYPQATAYLNSSAEPARLGNRGYSGSPGAGTFQCADGWLSTAANTPKQFKKLARYLDLQYVSEDEQLLDVQALNAHEGFVVAKDFEAVHQAFQQVLRTKRVAQVEEELNAIGVPAAKVRKLGEFLQEVREQGGVELPWRNFTQSDRLVQTAGLGFELDGSGAQTLRGAPALTSEEKRLSQISGSTEPANI
jgi:crotonobetainyl-CoA:carnitine CoA-transferase CaiB-like acyl-CoA transferase